MKILFLGSTDSPLIEWLVSVGEEVIPTMNPIDVTILEASRPDFVICYGYRHIIKKDVLDRIVGKAINLHISYLPFNRGADPNLWSLFEDTPKGVTIHYLDEGIDTGDIIVQKQVSFSKDDTLRMSYDKLQNEIQRLFRENWAKVRAGECDRKKQEGKGSYHRSNDKERLSDFLIAGWDTPVEVLRAFAVKVKSTHEPELPDS
jgi:methionyl-tRNA formyltransferase